MRLPQRASAVAPTDVDGRSPIEGICVERLPFLL